MSVDAYVKQFLDKIEDLDDSDSVIEDEENEIEVIDDYDDDQDEVEDD